MHKPFEPRCVHTPSQLTTVWHIQMCVDLDATDHESRVGSLLLLKRRTENGQGNSCSRRPLSIIIYCNEWCYRQNKYILLLHLFKNKAIVWVYPDGQSLGDRWAYLNYFLADFNILRFLIKTGSITSQVHLNVSSCPRCILSMALSPINKACSWLLDAACLPGTLFHPTLLYNMHEDFWHAYRASPQ